MRKRPSNNIFMENETKTDVVNKDDSITFNSFIQKTYRPIEQLNSDSMIDTEDISELSMMNGFEADKKLINETMLNLGFKKFDIPGHIDKVWLVEEIIETQ
jgi:hypothetical protein